MSQRWLLFCEADADFRAAATLIDQVLLLRCDLWVADLYGQDPSLVRRWAPDVTGAPWFDIHRIYALAAELGIKLRQGHFDGQPGGAGALMLDTILRVRRELDRRHGDTEAISAVIVVWDMDKQGPRRRAGLSQALAREPHAGAVVVLGCPDPNRETWSLAGFVPQDEIEEQRLQAVKQELGFAPNEEPHQLRAASEGAKRDAKRVLRALLGEGGWEREERCLFIGTAEVRARLAARGGGCGLEAFLQAVEDHLVPRVDPRAQPRRSANQPAL